MLPFFFRHYDTVVDRYFIYDNGSKDPSLDLLQAHPKVRVHHFDVTGDSFVEEESRLSEVIWKDSRGRADWVILLDIDEHIFHPDLAGYLRSCTARNITALHGIGYEMVADHFPTGEEALVKCVTLGARSPAHDKLCIFNPDALTKTRFGPGRHKAAPEGRVNWPEQPELLLLHYKQLGVEYAIRRSAELRTGLRAGDISQGWGQQYTWSPAEIAAKWSKLRGDAGPVPGVGTLSHIAPPFYDEERIVWKSGLVDAQWYMSAYPDIHASQMNPVSHFCILGWKQRRRPNYYFDTGWYLENHPEVRASGQNPLIHYIVSGERHGNPPSLRFDPEWYRTRYGLPIDASPLAHYLLQRQTGLVSPLPDFDAVAYLRDHPQREDGFQDPFEESCWRDTQSSPEPRTDPKPPPYRDVVSTLGTDPRARPDTMTVRPEVLLSMLKKFLRVVVVDEEGYRQAYPDVAAAIESGTIMSAREHFIETGYFEGRNPSPS
jgi:hypothetical protein